VFDAVYVLTDGGPANSTETLSIYAYKTLMRMGDFGYGSTLSVATFVCVMAAVTFCAGPFVWQLATSLRPESELLRLGPPSTLTVESYRSAFRVQPLG